VLFPVTLVGVIDLHSHSTFSDGSETPRRVVELANELGCSTVALTDHDGLEGLASASSRAKELGVNFIPGCEVSCAFAPDTMHFLCYFVEAGGGPLQDELARLRADRTARNFEMADRLASLGLPITYEEVAAQAPGGVVGRPHFAAMLVQKGAVASIGEAFDRYLAKGAPAYVEKARVSASTIVDQARRSGGVVALAHPLSLGLDQRTLERNIAELAAIGLTGLECYYAQYDLATRVELAALARRHKLVPTGGSDFHGSYKAGLRMVVGTGDLDVPDEIVEELTDRRP
jgi:predicted metal-dependent phosphoesterase TrpH